MCRTARAQTSALEMVEWPFSRARGSQRGVDEKTSINAALSAVQAITAVGTSLMSATKVGSHGIKDGTTCPEADEAMVKYGPSIISPTLWQWVSIIFTKSAVDTKAAVERSLLGAMISQRRETMPAGPDRESGAVNASVRVKKRGTHTRDNVHTHDLPNMFNACRNVVALPKITLQSVLAAL